MIISSFRKGIKQMSVDKNAKAPVAPNKSAKDHQKEMMADMPHSRTQTPKTNASTDAKDMGYGKK